MNMCENQELSNSPASCNKTNRSGRRLLTLGLVASASAIWLFLRTGNKPSRIGYPCQQAAIVNLEMFQLALLAVIPSLSSISTTIKSMRVPLILGMMMTGSILLINNPSLPGTDFSMLQESGDWVPLTITNQTALSQVNSSDLFSVQNASGVDGNFDLALSKLFALMESQDIPFYNTSSITSGLIGSNDVVILKVNGQWNYRGGTNSDLVKSVVAAITNHPDGFTGEIIIADNGQGGGNMDWGRTNSLHWNQSMLDVANAFPSSSVSSFLWDDLRNSQVDDYDENDFEDGYVLSDIWNSETEIFVSYPKFTTIFGTHISFKEGVWSNNTGFDSHGLKVINMPVMKSHFRYGVTGAVKNYMGVPKGHVVPAVDSTIPHEHFSIAQGGMGTLMVETRAPILNILDTIWINAHPMESSSRRGPWSTYSSASFTNIISASQDPVALDYWASRNILVPTAEHLNYTEYSSLDPDYEPLSDQYSGFEEMDESFHNYLNRSMTVLKDAGFQVTMNQDDMNVFTVILSGTSDPSITQPTIPEVDLLGLSILIGVPVALVIVVSGLFLKRRKMA
ncbi:MAG: DUF362 domain-containing protein [Candidatus Thorarchaeota archaeon]